MFKPLTKFKHTHQLQSLCSLSFNTFHKRCIITNPYSFQHSNNPFRNEFYFLSTPKFNCSTTNNNNNSNDNHNAIFDKNYQRYTEHRNEIITNEHPNLNEITHPNLVKQQIKATINKKPSKFEDYVLPHNIWTEEQVNNVKITHKKPSRIPDYVAYGTVQLLRTTWDATTGYITGRKLGIHKFSSRMWLLRLVFLETTAGVPGMMFGMARHLTSLRKLQRDRGWIKTLLSEAENERIHLLTAMYLYKPGRLLRYAIVIAQGVMCNFLFLGYLISPRFCHSLVGYLEEQAVKTYTLLLEDIDNGKHPKFNEQASNLAKSYWRLDSNASWRDVFANIRADEANHRDVNHTLADLTDDPKALNPFRMEHNDD